MVMTSSIMNHINLKAVQWLLFKFPFENWVMGQNDKNLEKFANGVTKNMLFVI